MIRVGVAGWDYPDWAGVVYPKGRGRDFDRLAFLAEFFDTVEINVTFYRQPDASALGGWARRVAGRPSFRFTAKLYQGLTHGGRIAGPPETAGPPDLEAEAALYRAGIEPLLGAGLLGAVLMQFPHSFHDREANRRHLETLAALLPGLPLVAELRHRSWDHDEALRFLSGLGIGFCNIDQPAVGATLRPTGHLTSRIAYIRLHGRNAENWFKPAAEAASRYDYLYSIEELMPWAERAQRLAERAEEVFIIANNHYRGKGPANALMLKSVLSRARVKAPSGLLDAYKGLRDYAAAGEAPAQGRLF
jgi:uncharacterized protein YecE (DUF72 family)